MRAAGGIFKGSDAAVHKAPKRKRTLAGPFPFFATAGLPLAALVVLAAVLIFRLERPMRVPSVPIIVIIPIAMRWVVIVKLAMLVMLVIRVARWLRRHNADGGARQHVAADDGGISHRHRSEEHTSELQS